MNAKTIKSNKLKGLKRWLSVAALSAMAAVFNTSAMAENVEKSFDVAQGGKLTLDTDVGAINISTHGEDRVDVRVEIEGFDSDVFAVSFNHRGDSLTIEGDKQSHGSSWGRRSVKFEIVVPERYDLDLKTSGGSIRVANLTGRVDANTSGGSLRFGTIIGDIHGRTSGGSITVEGARGEVDIRTSGGSLKVGDVTGNVKGRTSGGSIDLGKVSGSADVKTSGGSISIEEVGGAVVGRTSGGSIKVTIAKQPQGATELRTSGGSVTAYLAEDIAVNVNARGDKIKSDFEIDGKRKAKRKLEGAVNGGGPELDLRTSAGTVTIKKI